MSFRWATNWIHLLFCKDFFDSSIVDFSCRIPFLSVKYRKCDHFSFNYCPHTQLFPAIAKVARLPWATVFPELEVIVRRWPLKFWASSVDFSVLCQFSSVSMVDTGSCKPRHLRSYESRLLTGSSEWVVVVLGLWWLGCKSYRICRNRNSVG